jgi:hypothetical protein
MLQPYPQTGKLERLAREKYSSLLQKSVNYSRKKFYRIGTVAGKQRVGKNIFSPKR